MILWMTLFASGGVVRTECGKGLPSLAVVRHCAEVRPGNKPRIFRALYAPFFALVWDSSFTACSLKPSPQPELANA